MASKRKGRSNGTNEKPRTSEVIKLTRLAILLLFLQACALGLKCWNDYQSNATALKSAQADAAHTLTQSVFDHLRSVDTAVRLADDLTNSNANTSAILRTSLPSPIVVFRIDPHSTDADRVPPSSLVAARTLSQTDGGLTLTNTTLISTHIIGTETWAVEIPLAEVAERPASDQLVVLANGLSSAGIGNGLSLNSDQITKLTRQSGFSNSLAWTQFSRTISYCTPVNGTEVNSCAIQRVDLLSMASLLPVIVYGLLFIGPALAIYSLLNAIKVRRKEHGAAVTETENLEHQLELTFASAKCGVWEWLIETDEVIITRHLAAMLGTDGVTQLTGQQWLSFFHPDDRTRIKEALNAALESGTVTATFRAPKTRTGAKFIELRGSVDRARTKENITYLTGIAIDVSERRLIEERVRYAERRLRESIEGFPGPFALCDNRNRLLFWNRAFIQDFKFKPEAVQRGVRYNTILMEMSKAIRSERPTESGDDHREVVLQDGRWFQLSERKTIDGSIVMVGVDVSAVKRNEKVYARNERKLLSLVQELERSEGRASELMRKYSEEKSKAEQASKTKGAFLANMSHELRTPLNAINGFSEILVKELYGPLGDDRYKGYAQDILLSGQHLLDMINDILDTAKIEAGKMSIDTRPIDPIDPIDAAIRMIRRRAEDKSITLDFTFKEDVPEIEADHRAVKQMVLNLVTNAIKFTEAGGRIEVSVQQENQHVAVHVKDNGCGISEEDLPNLANPFVQASRKDDSASGGTGLGLALTKSFAEMHGGYLSIESKLDKGTTVSFFLPIKEKETAEFQVA